MKTSLDCLPCLLRQATDAIRLSGRSPEAEVMAVRELLLASTSLNFDQSPPQLSGTLQSQLHEITGCADPYRDAKQRFNRLARDDGGGGRGLRHREVGGLNRDLRRTAVIGGVGVRLATVQLARRRFPAVVLLARRTPEHVSGVECCGVDVAVLHGWPLWLPGLRWQAIAQGL